MALLNDMYCQICDRFNTKNNGINIFILVDICIEKLLDIGQPIFQEKLNRDESMKLEIFLW